VYNRYLEKSSQVSSLEDLDYICFHSPYTKLVQKSFGRLLYNDFKRDPDAEKFGGLRGLGFENVTREESFLDRGLEKKFMELTKSDFAKKVL
jgi:hydroxymethylglutaryl-CoA synthase